MPGGPASLLKRYWFKFDELPKYSLLRFGCEVTAYNYDDAISLISQSVFKDKAMPPIRKVIENVDTSTLDQGHTQHGGSRLAWSVVPKRLFFVIGTGTYRTRRAG
jgi:hypothetical protein